MLSKELEIFTTKDSIKLTNCPNKVDFGDLKFVVNSSNLETDFSELKDPVAFLDNIKKREISIEEARYKQE